MTSKILPENVVVDILLKLPVKSLLRFRGVCKGWLLLLDSLYFVSKHLEYSKNKKTDCILVKRNFKRQLNAFSFVSEETLDIVSPDINVPLPSGESLFGPINGIVSVSYGETILFCNPSTREFKQLPPCCYDNDNSESRGLVVRVVAHGFGFDEKSNDYKFVIIIHRWLDNARHRNNHLDMKFKIYSLRSDCWRSLDHLTFPDARFENAPQGYLNGACHWFVQYLHNDGLSDLVERALTIMSFRMDTEVLEEVPIPNRLCLASLLMSRTIFVSSNEPKNLSLILNNPENADGIYEVWVMTEYKVKESWSMQYRIGPLRIRELFSVSRDGWMHMLSPRIIPPSPMSIGNDNELLLCGRNGEFVLCNLDTLNIRVSNAYEWNNTVIKSAFYMETLVSLKSAGYAG